MTQTHVVNSPEGSGLPDPTAANPGPSCTANAPGGIARLALLGTFDPADDIAVHTVHMMEGLNAAARLRGLGLDMLVLSGDGAGLPAVDPHCLHRCWNRNVFDTAQALGILAREQVNILHVQLHYELIANADFADFLRGCRKLGIRLFGTFHFTDEHAELATEVINLMDRAFVRLKRGADGFISRGAQPGRLSMLPIGVSPDRVATSSAEAKRSLGLPEHLELVTFLGSFEPHERILGILTTLPDVVARHPEVQFAFMGDDRPDDPAMSADIRQCMESAIRLGLKHHVTFQPGSLSEEEAGLYLAASNVVVLKHDARRDDLPPAAAFALTHGRPLVTPDTSAFVALRDFTLQISSDMDLAEAINRVLEEPDLAAHMEARASAFAQETSQLRMGELLLGEYGLIPTESSSDRPGTLEFCQTTPAPPELVERRSSPRDDAGLPGDATFASLGRLALPRLVSRNAIGIELGVASGYYSNVLLSSGRFSQLFSIDAWADHHDTAEYLRCMSLLARHEDRSVVMRMFFNDALPHFPDNFFDFIYIDAYAHTGQQEGRILADWYPKLKTHGLFCGHDYDSAAWPKTVAAVDAFASTLGKKVQLVPGVQTGFPEDIYASWYFRK